jgi:hypothetical protein
VLDKDIMSYSVCFQDSIFDNDTIIIEERYRDETDFVFDDFYVKKLSFLAIMWNKLYRKKYGLDDKKVC